MEQAVQVIELANGGRLSNRKRDRHFSMLTDPEVAEMEEAMAEHFGDPTD